jgi:hypothetical protein
MSTLTLEQFVNSIRNLYNHQQASPSSSHQTLDQQQTSNKTSNNATGPINYSEIFNTINSNLEVFTENANNLIDNVLPVFTLPEYTLPNMAVLFAVVTQLQQQAKSNDAEPSRSNVTTTSNVNQEKILNEVENCIKFADEKQVYYI